MNPVQSLNSLINVKRNLPNGGGQFNVANSTPSGVVAPVQSPDAGLMYALANIGKGAQSQNQVQDQPVTPMSTPAPAPAPTAPPAPVDVDSLIKQYSSGNPSQLTGVGLPSSNSGNAPLDFMSLRQEQLNDRANGTGLYAMPQGVSLTPDQVFGLRSMADKHYSDLIQSATDYSKQQIEEKKASLLTGGTGNPDPEVDALFNMGLITGGTETEKRKRILGIKNLEGDDKKRAIRGIAYDSLGPTQKENFTNNEVAAQTAEYALSSVDSELVNNPYKYTLNNYVTYFGGKKDPKYTNFVQNIASVVAPIRKSFFGASLTQNEQVSANQFLPDPSTDDIKTLVLKTKNVQGLANFTNDVMIANKLGTPRPKITDYMSVDKDGNPVEKTNSSSGSSSTSSGDSVGWV